MDGGLGTVLTPTDIVMACSADSMEEAIEFSGRLLVCRGSVSAEYIEGMKQRERVVSTYLGNGVALPHGVLESKQYIRSTGVVVAQYPRGVDWGGCGTAHLVVGLAAVGDDHMRVLSQLASVLQDEELCRELAQVDDAASIYECLSAVPSDDD
ncbi:PTS sugar transporter subunit IIA [Candidatus Poriferisodalis sp.]|uniref:PTS sugar transporter subunit IIA n=1 Tax=Candidatus Poriferisodalis sp. TaxID=3101277 RepID=UPI003B02C85E